MMLFVKWIRILAVISFSFSACAGLLNVLGRYVPYLRVSGADEAAILAFIWSVFLGSIVSLADREHLRVGFLEEKLTGQKARYLKIFADLATAGALVLILVASIQQAYINVGLNSFGVLRYPLNLLYGVVAVFAASGLILVGHRVIKGVRSSVHIP